MKIQIRNMDAENLICQLENEISHSPKMKISSLYLKSTLSFVIDLKQWHFYNFL